MLILNVSSFAKGVIYNAANTYATLGRGEGYTKLKPVIAWTITNFEMFENDRDIISHFLFKQTKNYFDYPEPEI